MPSAYYQSLALRWKPGGKSNFQFKIITAAVVGVMFFLSVVISSVNVPEKKRLARPVLPERIANFMLEKKLKPQPVVEKPKPKSKPKPKPKPKPEKPEPASVKKPIVKKIPPKKTDTKPLTKKEKRNRDTAAESGLLALSNELADLMDTEDLTTLVGGKVNTRSASATRAGSSNAQLLMANVSAGSGGVDSGKYTTTRIAQTNLSKRELTQVQQSLISPEARSNAKKRKKKARTGDIRAQESITIVFDQNKSKLYSIYSRARRKDPSLKGKIVLKITILPSGKVGKIKVLSSELNNRKLESRLVSRIKQFNFGAMKVEAVTVTYPIEFLPS